MKLAPMTSPDADVGSRPSVWPGRPSPLAVLRAEIPPTPSNTMNQQSPAFGQSDIVNLSDEDAAVALLERAVGGLWEVVNDLTRLRRTTRQNYRVTIFGSARLKPGTPAYEGVKKLAAELTAHGLRHPHRRRPRPHAGGE